MIGMGWLAGLLLKKGLSGGKVETISNIVQMIMVALLFGSIGFFTGCQHGKAIEAAAWEKDVQKKVDARWRAKVAADRRDQAISDGGKKVIEDRRKELDNENSKLPDQGLTDRQRNRRCAELRRQGQRCELPATGSGRD